MGHHTWILEGNLYGEGDIKSRYFYSYIIICNCECVNKEFTNIEIDWNWDESIV